MESRMRGNNDRLFEIDLILLGFPPYFLIACGDRFVCGGEGRRVGMETEVGPTPTDKLRDAMDE